MLQAVCVMLLCIALHEQFTYCMSFSLSLSLKISTASRSAGQSLSHLLVGSSHVANCIEDVGVGKAVRLTIGEFIGAK